MSSSFWGNVTSKIQNKNGERCGNERITELKINKLCNKNIQRKIDILPGDVSQFEDSLESKQSYASWIAEAEKPRTVVLQRSYEMKTMVCIFFRTTSV